MPSHVKLRRPPASPWLRLSVAACVLCLRSSDVTVQEHAAATLGNLSDAGTKSRRADIVATKGGLVGLCQLLRSSSAH